MRNLVRKLGGVSLPLLATAWLAGCQQSLPDGSAGEPQAAAPIEERPEALVAPEPGEQGQLQEILQFCGWECKAFAAGEVNISGVRKLDAFFAASASLQAQAASLQAEVRAELVSMAAVLGIEGAATMSIDQLTVAIDESVRLGFGGKIQGGITIAATPPKCEVSASASLEAAAKCDATVDPGMATVECSGSCEAEASAMASCSGEATLSCKGTAPAFKCEGTCTGRCELEANAKCEGECKGTCEVNGDVACNGTCEMNGTAACDGECAGSTDAGGNCTGECKLNMGAMCTGTCKLNAGATCEGSCNGNCELSAGGNCTGECKGECEYTPPSGTCEGGAKAKCEASGSAMVQCNGKCDGEVKPPMVDADCEATAKAEAQFAAECHPPSIDIKYNLTAEAQAEFAGDINAKAAFEGKVQAVGKAFANIAAKGAKIEGVLTAGGGLVSAGGEAITDAIATISASGDPKLIVGAYCAGEAIGDVSGSLQASVNSLTATAQGVASITATFSGA